jgi:hypothetical protein
LSKHTPSSASLNNPAFLSIPDLDPLAPFLMNIVSNGNVWIFAGSNTALTAGRRNPDCAIFPYQTADKLLRHPHNSGVLSLFWVGNTLWEPWGDSPRPANVTRQLYKHECGTCILFEETNNTLGLRLRWQLEAGDEFGLVRKCSLENVGSAPVKVRSLDGWHHLLPPGVNQATYAAYSYLAAAYMRHELSTEVGLGIYTLNAAISDRAEPAESLRTSCAWSLGHRQPVRLLSDRQVGAFRSGQPVKQETEIRGDFGAYLVADELELAPGQAHEWFTVADTGLDHRALVKLRQALKSPEKVRQALLASTEANTQGLRQRVAAADGLQQTADHAASVHHFSNVMFNVMRGGTLDQGYDCPSADFAKFLKSRNSQIAARHQGWLAKLPERISLTTLAEQAAQQGDTQLRRLANEYLPLCFARRHGDPSRPWNRFSIETRDANGKPTLGYSGNWRDIFQNWEALAQSYPVCLSSMVAVFLNASTADGYNPYRITRDGIDWEVHDPNDAWSHIGYWGDHQIIYLLRLLESHERFWPGKLAGQLDERAYASALVPYEIGGFDEIARNPKHTIHFNDDLHRRLMKRTDEIGGDAKLVSDARGEVRLVSLAEKLLVPLLVKLSNLIPGGGVWLNTQRPEWNDANNALAGWGLSVVTVCYLRRYLSFLDRLLASAKVETLHLSAPVAELLTSLTTVLRGATNVPDDAARYRIAEALGRAGEKHRQAVYAGGDVTGQSVSVKDVRDFVAAALPVVDATIRSNGREDGTVHSYNLLEIKGQKATVKYLNLMLEGQVAVLSSGLFTDAEALRLLDGLRQSALWRADQRSYILYPDREIAPFLSRNTLPDGWRTNAPVLAEMAQAGDESLIVLDDEGAAHFHPDFANAGDLGRRIDGAAARWKDGLARDREAILGIWEEIFHHAAFTGRSGSFFAFEGLGSIYWHMVAKLLLAVQEYHDAAKDSASKSRLSSAYTHVRDGLGFRKTPEEYGAFPTDAYSHTPKHTGAQQPGMTGQVKEEVLTRIGELGVLVQDGQITFAPTLLGAEEFNADPSKFNYVDISGAERTADVPAKGLAFTFCQVPVIYQLGKPAGIVIYRADGSSEKLSGKSLSLEQSREIFLRSGAITSLTITTDISPSL